MLRRALANAAIILVIIAPLIAGSVWVYHASAAQFAFQRDIRIALEAKDALFQAFLVTEDDVRGFAATADPYYAAAYRAHVRSYGEVAGRLLADMRPLAASGSAALVAQERATDAQWNRSVALPILGHRPKTAYLLRVVDPELGRRMLAADRAIGSNLAAAEATSQRDRQRLLSRMLVAGVLLVASVAAVVILTLLSRAAADQRELRAAILYEEERRASEMLQAAIVPERLPHIAGVRLSATYVPAAQTRRIGGDWYEIVEMRNGRVLLIIGDVAGHGLEAAVVMNRARRAILAAAVSATDPARILQRANRSLMSRGSGLVTAACCTYDPATSVLLYAGAGHPPPVIVPPSAPAFTLLCGAPPLGVVEDLDAQSVAYRFDPGSLLVMYTDGLIEERRDIAADQSSLLEAAQANRTVADPAAAIFAALLPERHPRDDVAVLTMLAGHPIATRVRETARPVSAF